MSSPQESDECKSEVTGEMPQQESKKNDRVDGGLQSWIQVVGVFIIWTNSWGISNTFGAFQTYYESSGFNKSPSEISWIGSLQSFLLLFVGLISGPLYDAGYFKHLIITGNFFVVFGLMMTSLCTEYWQAILAQGLCCGIGFGLIYIPGVSIIPQYFAKRRVLASGLAASGSGFGGLIYPIVFHRLQPQIGFPWTVRIIGFLTLFLSIICVLILRNKSPPGKLRKVFDFKALTELPFLFNALGLFFALAGLYVPFFYISSYAIQNHITGQNLAFYLLPIMNAASIAGRIIPNFLADKTGPFNMLIPCTVISGILCFAWIGIHNAAGFVVFAVLYGFFSGTFLSLPPTAVATLTKDMSMLGTRSGTCFVTACFGVLIGTPVSGAILAGTGQFVGLQIFGGCCIVAATFFNVLARVTKAGWGWTKI